jgi:hypothetical protein
MLMNYEKLENCFVEELDAVLYEATKKRKTKRSLTWAIIYKRRPSTPMIAECLNIREQTIYR